MRICCSTQLPFLSCNFNILKVFPKIFSTELTTTKCPAEENKWGKKSQKKRRGAKVERSWNWNLPSGHAQTWQKLIFCIWYEGCKVFNLLTAILVFNNEWGWVSYEELCILWRLWVSYEDWGGCFPEADNTLRGLHNSSYDMKAEFNNNFILFFNFIIHSK